VCIAFFAVRSFLLGLRSIPPSASILSCYSSTRHHVHAKPTCRLCLHHLCPAVCSRPPPTKLLPHDFLVLNSHKPFQSATLCFRVSSSFIIVPFPFWRPISLHQLTSCLIHTLPSTKLSWVIDAQHGIYLTLSSCGAACYIIASLCGTTRPCLRHRLVLRWRPTLP